MNKSKWEVAHSIQRWIAKLGEEFGEVCKEIADQEIIDVPHYERAIKELKHVEFIARKFREDLERRLG